MNFVERLRRFPDIKARDFDGNLGQYIREEWPRIIKEWEKSKQLPSLYDRVRPYYECEAEEIMDNFLVTEKTESGYTLGIADDADPVNFWTENFGGIRSTCRVAVFGDRGLPEGIKILRVMVEGSVIGREVWIGLMADEEIEAMKEMLVILDHRWG